MIYEAPRYLYSGDQYLTIEVGDELSLEANFRVIGINEAIENARIEGVIETLPGWRSILLSYDSLKIRTQDLISELKRLVQNFPQVKEVPSRLIELPVKYGGQWGGDLEFIAQENNISPEDVG